MPATVRESFRETMRLRTPHPALRTVVRLALLLFAFAAPSVRAQANEPLRKTDLIRYLSGGTMTTTQIAQLVARNCVSFTPTRAIART